MFLDRVGDHPARNILYDPSHFVLQQLDYLAFIDIYHGLRMFHVKDAEFRPTGRQWRLWRLSGVGETRRPLPLAGRRSGRFRAIFSRLTEDGFHRLGGARMGVLRSSSRSKAPRRARQFIAAHIIQRHRAARSTTSPAARHDQRGQPQALGTAVLMMAPRRFRLGMVGGGRAPLSAPCTASRPGSTATTRSVAGALVANPTHQRTTACGARHMRTWSPLSRFQQMATREAARPTASMWWRS